MKNGDYLFKTPYNKSDGIDEKISGTVDIVIDTGQVNINKDSGGLIVTRISKCIIEPSG